MVVHRMRKLTSLGTICDRLLVRASCRSQTVEYHTDETLDRCLRRRGTSGFERMERKNRQFVRRCIGPYRAGFLSLCHQATHEVDELLLRRNEVFALMHEGANFGAMAVPLEGN